MAFWETVLGKYIMTMAIAAVPVVELRGAIPVGVGMLGRSALPSVYLAAVLGNMLPVPFIIVYIRRIFQFLLYCLLDLFDRLLRSEN